MSRRGLILPLDAHRECWELLPWIANERAAAKDVARVEPHLCQCQECQQELAEQRRLRDAIRSEEAIVLAPQTSLQKLLQRIDGAEGTRSDAIAAGTTDREPTPSAAVESTRGWSRWLPIAASVQGVALAALLAALWWQSREDLTAPRFMTLTTHTSAAPGPVIRVVFANHVSLEEVDEILRSIDGQIVAGPSEARVYTLGFTTDADADRIDRALAQLRSDKRVVFSEAALARAESP